MEKAVKHDKGKAKISMVTTELMEGISHAMEYGAKKYSKNNFKSGMEWSRVLDATYRHLNKFKDKVELDEESNLPHLYHAAACLNMLLYYYENKVGEDDR